MPLFSSCEALQQLLEVVNTALRPHVLGILNCPTLCGRLSLILVKLVQGLADACVEEGHPAHLSILYHHMPHYVEV